ncbi:MAG: DUF456 family protein [Firmicutes bacterium]|nr:DUF456 family protein [Bacillota bacterium]
MSYLPLIITFILFIVGIIGTVLPLLPGVTLIWGGMLLYGILTGFPPGLSWDFYLFQGIAALLIMGVDYIATAVGVKRSGGSKAATWGAAVGLLLGIFMGPAGIIFGPFLGALVGELLNGFPLDRALRSSIASLVGLLGGIILKLGIEIAMIFWFIKRIIPLW